MTTRKYLSTSQETTLTSAMNSSQTTMVVNSASGLLGSITPAAGETFTVVIDPDTSLEEIVDVIAPSNPNSNTLTITRPIDGSAAIAHSAGAKVRHMAIGRDFREANVHQESNLTAHAATTSAQLASVISDETGTGSLVFNTNPTIVTPTIASFANATHNHTNAAGGGTLTSAAVSDFTEAAQDAVGAMFSGNTELGISVTYDDATNKVNFDVNDPVITLTGDVTGSATMTDLGNTTITTAISAGSIVAADIADGTITSSKIADGTIVNADISAAAGITLEKLATDPLARANHTGTQTASTISDFDTQVRTSRLNQMTSPNAAVSMNSQKLSDLATPTAGTDAANESYVDTQVSNLVASAPGALDTLNELASALGNDANFSTTVTNSIATKVSKSGDTMTGNLTMSGGSKVTGIPTPTVSSDAVPLDYVTTLYGSTSSAATSAAAASTSAANAATSATASSNSATSAAASATAAAASAVAAAASAASVDATATTATELRQYGAEGSILNNIPTRVHPAENLLRQAAYWIDSNHTSSSSQTVDNLGWTGSLLPTTLGSSTAADSNDPAFLDWTGTNYVYLPGVATSFLSVPNDSPVQITGDIDVRQWVALDDWTPSSENEVGSKTGGPGNRGWIFQVTTTGALRITYSADGTTLLTRTSTATISAADGSNLWVRFTLDVDNGAGGNDVKFFTSTDGTNWTQLGATVTNAGTTSIFNTTAVVRDNGGSTSKAGKLYRFQIFASIDGTDKRLDIDTSVITSGAATSFFALSGQTVTINRSTSGRKTVAVVHPCWLFGTDDYMEVNNRYMSSGTYLYLPGVSGNTATSPDAAALDITGDIDIRAKIAMDDWTPSASNALIAKYGTAGQRSYYLALGSPTGLLQLNWSADGTNVITKNSTVAPTITDGSTLWVRVTLDVDNGASGNTVTFYTSTDGTTWTQLGDAVVTAGTTSIHSGTSILEIGTWGAGNAIARGKFFRAQVLNGINGIVAFDANFETSITSLNQASFTESSANAATVTINRSGSAYRSAGITQAGYLYPGATNTFTASATDFLNFGAADSFTVMAAFRQFGTNDSYIITKRAGSGASNNGYALYNVSGITYLGISDGVNLTFASRAYISGNLTTSNAVRNVTSDNLQVTNNTTSGTAATDSTTGTLAYYHPLRIGALATTTSGALEGELYAAAVFRRVLTDAEIASIVTYYAGRVGA